MSSNIISAAVIDKSTGGTRQNKSFMKVLFLDRTFVFQHKRLWSQSVWSPVIPETLQERTSLTNRLVDTARLLRWFGTGQNLTGCPKHDSCSNRSRTDEPEGVIFGLKTNRSTYDSETRSSIDRQRQVPFVAC